MTVYIAGGCFEHGRNSFLVSQGGTSILLDCGYKEIHEHKAKEYPLLTVEQIQALSLVVLSHSHADHTGGVSWLEERGYTGSFLLTRATEAYCQVKPRRSLYLEDMGMPLQWLMVHDHVRLMWGYSGHCDGSVWVLLEMGGQRLLYSGDYIEDSALFPCHPLRDMRADLAIIDCAYGHEAYERKPAADDILRETALALEKQKRLVFPVPANGRGGELLLLLALGFPHVSLFVDAALMRCVENYRHIFPQLKLADDWRDAQISFFSDPHMRKIGTQEASLEADVVLSGSPVEGSPAQEWLQSGRARILMYPVHQGLVHVMALAGKNSFSHILPFHSRNGRLVPKLMPASFLVKSTGSFIDF